MKQTSLDDYSIITQQINPLLLEKAKCILLVGSLAEGLETSTSDVDIFVIADGYSGSYFDATAPARYEGRIIEVKLLTSSAIDLSLNRFRSTSYASLDPRELEYIHKLSKGIVIYGQSYAAELQTKFNHDLFCKNMVKYYADYAVDIFADYIGSAIAHDKVSSIGFLNFMIETAADSWLSSRGDTYPKAKWRGRRVMAQRNSSSDVVEHYISHFYTYTKNQLDGFNQYALDCSMLFLRLKCAALAGNAFNEAEDCATLSISQPLIVYENGVNFFCKTISKTYAIDQVAAAILLCMYQSRSLKGLLQQVNDICINRQLAPVSKDVLHSRIQSLTSLHLIKSLPT